MDTNASELVRRAAWRAFVAGFAVAALLVTVVALGFAVRLGEFRLRPSYGVFPGPNA